MAEDFELELRMLKIFKKVHNFPDVLLFIDYITVKLHIKEEKKVENIGII